MTKDYSNDDTDVFIEKMNGEFKIKLDVFENKGLAIIKKAKVSNKKIILLDEVGGIELLSETFKKKC